jgi:hypothetical protein
LVDTQLDGGREFTEDEDGSSGSSTSSSDSNSDSRAVAQSDTESTDSTGQNQTGGSSGEGSGNGGQALALAEDDSNRSFDSDKPDESCQTCGSKPVVVSTASPDTTTFIEIELVDEEGNPVPGESFEVTLPDGTVVDGSLDDQGQARVEGIDPPGSCQITFPDLDKDAWKNA